MLFNKSARWISENTWKKMKSVKSAKKQAWKINFENEKQLTKLVKKIDLELFHWQLKHVKKKMLRHILKIIRNIEIQNEKFSDDCEICMHAQKIKMQSHEFMKSVSKLTERLHIDFWKSYQQEDMNESWYILMMINDCIKHEWIFIIKNWSFEILVEILKFLIKWIECESDWKIKQMRIHNAKKFLKLAK